MDALCAPDRRKSASHRRQPLRLWTQKIIYLTMPTDPQKAAAHKRAQVQPRKGRLRIALENFRRSNPGRAVPGTAAVSGKPQRPHMRGCCETAVLDGQVRRRTSGLPLPRAKRQFPYTCRSRRTGGQGHCFLCRIRRAHQLCGILHLGGLPGKTFGQSGNTFQDY